MKSVTLLGDSIIDNISYVDPPGLCVLGHLSEIKPNWDFDQRAVDGHTTHDLLAAQLGQPIKGPVVLSIGGNDLLNRIDIITSPTRVSPVDLLEELYREAAMFRDRYQTILGQLTTPALICTVYNPVFAKDPSLAPLQDAAEMAIAIFNDVIQRSARNARFDLLELRDLFTDADDYANPIEPSDRGGHKLAKAIVRWAKSL